MSCIVVGGVRGYKQAADQRTPHEPNKKEAEVICVDFF